MTHIVEFRNEQQLKRLLDKVPADKLTQGSSLRHFVSPTFSTVEISALVLLLWSRDGRLGKYERV